MTLDKEDKQCLAWGVVVCFVIAATVTFNVWMWRNPNRPENPDSSKEEIQVVVKDSIETQRLRTMLYDLRAEFDRYKRQSERTKKFLTNKINENETFKQKATTGHDSILSPTLDSVLTRYSILFEQRENKNSNSGGF